MNINNLRMKTMDVLISNCAGFEGSDLAENGYSSEFGLWKTIELPISSRGIT